MSSEINLLITFDPAHSMRSEDEAKALLRSVGEENPSIVNSGIPGVLLLKTGKNPKELVKKLFIACKKDPGQFTYTYHWIPIDSWASSDIKSLVKNMQDFNKKLDPNKTWKIEITKRQYETSVSDLIKALTEKIDKPKVDLKNAQQIIRVEIIGKKAACSLLASDEFLDISKIKSKK